MFTLSPLLGGFYCNRCSPLIIFMAYSVASVQDCTYLAENFKVILENVFFSLYKISSVPLLLAVFIVESFRSIFVANM